jgi:acetyltransferase-like isoleucine patch superfamily enzyme
MMWLDRARIKAHSLRLKATYRFAQFGNRVSIHHSCEIKRCYSNRIAIGSNVILDCDVWLNIPYLPEHNEPALVIEEGSRVGRRCIISAANSIHIGRNVLFAPAVFITDHNHIYSDPAQPIVLQGITTGGSIIIEENCWFGYGSMVLAPRETVIIGRNSVIGSYAVVTESCLPCSILVGSPARVIKRWDPDSGNWMPVNSSKKAKAR